MLISTVSFVCRELIAAGPAVGHRTKIQTVVLAVRYPLAHGEDHCSGICTMGMIPTPTFVQERSIPHPTDFRTAFGSDHQTAMRNGKGDFSTGMRQTMAPHLMLHHSNAQTVAHASRIPGCTNSIKVSLKKSFPAQASVHRFFKVSIRLPVLTSRSSSKVWNLADYLPFRV